MLTASQHFFRHLSLGTFRYQKSHLLTLAASLGLPTLVRRSQAFLEGAQHTGATAALEVFDVIARNASSLDVDPLLTLMQLGLSLIPNACHTWNSLATQV